MNDTQYVSRGGYKLAAAIENWKLKINNLTVLDVGSSTGGFVDCLLQHGAQKVYSVDTSYGELAWKLRQDPRVVVMERTNALHLELPEQVDLITVDTSWTKLELVLPVVAKYLKPEGQIIALLKPHYQVDKKLLIKGVLPKEHLETIKNDVILKIENCITCPPTGGLKITGEIPSPVLGGGGNHEFLLQIKAL